VTKQINVNCPDKENPFWQRGYYEHVIRDEKEFSQIGEYILCNPMKWAEDRENPDSNYVKPLSFENR
jgi:putative transposase